MEQMKKKLHLGKTNREKVTTFGLVIALYVFVEILQRTGNLSNLMRGQLVPICAYMIMALSLNLTVGILGELSLGHAGFVSIGAFTGITVASLLRPVVSQNWILFVIALVAGGTLAGIVGFLIGIPVLRLRGDYLAIVTLAFGEIVKSLVNNLYIGFDQNGIHFAFLHDTLNLAEGGKKIIAGPMGATTIPKVSTFLAGVLLVLFCLYFLYRLLGSKMGRAIKAMRDNSIAAESVGINITRYKLTAFTMSAFMAGMGGVLFGLNYSSIIAGKFNVDLSILILVFVVLGGLSLSQIWGLFGAANQLHEALRACGAVAVAFYAGAVEVKAFADPAALINRQRKRPCFRAAADGAEGKKQRQNQRHKQGDESLHRNHPFAFFLQFNGTCFKMQDSA